MSPKLTQLANLIKLAKADGNLTKEEVMLIYGIAARNGVSKFELDEVIERADSIETSVPKDSAQAVKFLYQLLVMSAVDFDVSEDEVSLIRNVGAELGLSAGKVDQAIAYLIENQKTDLDDEEVASLFGE